MDLQDLLQLDLNKLKSLDWSKVKDELLRRRDILIIVVLALLTAVVSLNFFIVKNHQKSTVQGQLTLLEQKLQAMKLVTQARTNLQEAQKKSAEEIPDDELISKIAAMANARGIQISNFSPLIKDEKSNYSLTTVVLNIVATDFQTMWAFMNDIESTSYALRIEEWTTSFNSYLNQYLINPQAPKPPMTAKIVIGALHIK